MDDICGCNDSVKVYLSQPTNTQPQRDPSPIPQASVCGGTLVANLADDPSDPIYPVTFESGDGLCNQGCSLTERDVGSSCNV